MKKWKEASLPEVENPEKDDGVQAWGLEDVLLGGVPRALHPASRGHQALEGERLLLVPGVLHPLPLPQQVASEVHPSIPMLLPEHGVQSEEQNGQADVHPSWRSNVLKLHLQKNQLSSTQLPSPPLTTPSFRQPLKPKTQLTEAAPQTLLTHSRLLISSGVQRWRGILCCGDASIDGGGIWSWVGGWMFGEEGVRDEHVGGECGCQVDMGVWDDMAWTGGRRGLLRVFLGEVEWGVVK